MADELTPNERYATAREHMTCPDCGGILVFKPMLEIDPKGQFEEDDIGLKCTAFDVRVNPPECKYWAFAGEKR